MNKTARILFIIFVFFSQIAVFAQNPLTESSIDTGAYIGRQGLRSFNIEGGYEGTIYYRDFDKLLDGKQSQQKLDLGNGDALRLYFSGRPTGSTFFKTDLYVAPGMFGMGYPDATNYVAPQIGVNLESQINTDHGNLYIKVGGIQFTKLSKLTLWSTENKGESLFDKNMWTTVQEAGKDYESYYSQGTIVRDFTWGNKFLEGFSSEISNLPFGLQSKLIFARTPSNGQTAYTSAIPKISYGGQLRKIFGVDYIGINSFSGISKDSIAVNNGESTYKFSKNNNGYYITSGDFSYSFLKNDMTLAGEIGSCKYVDSTSGTTWSKAADFTLISRHKLISAPLTFHYFYIEPKFISLEAGYNTYIQNASTVYNGVNGSTFATGAYMSDIDFINGNRKGGDIRTEINVSGLKINLAAGMSQEVDHLSNMISYSHRVNCVMFSGVYQYQNNFGPYKNLNTSYRSYYECVSIDTANSNYKNKPLNFNVVECNLKYKINLFGKPLFMFYLASYSSAQDNISVIPVTNDQAFMRVQYHELEAYYKLSKCLALASYAGIENMTGNSLTYLGTNATKNSNPTNLTAKGLGLGFDLNISSAAILFVRARWFDYNDKNNPLNVYKGFEGMLDFRVSF